MLFTCKTSTQVGFWYVRSLGNPTKQNGRLCGVLMTMKEKAIEILAVSDMRCPSNGVSRSDESVRVTLAWQSVTGSVIAEGLL